MSKEEVVKALQSVKGDIDLCNFDEADGMIGYSELRFITTDGKDVYCESNNERIGDGEDDYLVLNWEQMTDYEKARLVAFCDGSRNLSKFTQECESFQKKFNCQPNLVHVQILWKDNLEEPAQSCIIALFPYDERIPDSLDEQIFFNCDNVEEFKSLLPLTNKEDFYIGGIRGVDYIQPYAE